MSTVALRDLMASACWLMLSISPCCEEAFRATFEYCSSTGRVRKTQAVVGSIARNTVRARMGRLLLMQTYQSSTSFEYIVPERLQKLGRTLCVLSQPWSSGRPFEIVQGRHYYRQLTSTGFVI